MKLFVLRHGDAQRSARTDNERELTSHGREQVKKMACFFSNKGCQVGRIICSPYTRAKQTAELFREVAGIAANISESAAITPDIPLSRAIKHLDQQFEDNVLMVSHQPLVSSLITYLVWGETTPRVAMDTASLACLEMDIVQPSMAELEWIQHAHEAY